MVFNATINNISVILCVSVVLVNETGIPAENDRLSASHYHTFTSRTALNIYDKCRLNKNIKAH